MAVLAYIVLLIFWYFVSHNTAFILTVLQSASGLQLSGISLLVGTICVRISKYSYTMPFNEVHVNDSHEHTLYCLYAMLHFLYIHKFKFSVLAFCFGVILNYWHFISLLRPPCVSCTIQWVAKVITTFRTTSILFIWCGQVHLSLPVLRLFLLVSYPILYHYNLEPLLKLTTFGRVASMLSGRHSKLYSLVTIGTYIYDTAYTSR